MAMVPTKLETDDLSQSSQNENEIKLLSNEVRQAMC